MRIERLACNEQPHDLAGSLENHIDAGVSQKTLDGQRIIASCRERLRCFVAAPAENLDSAASSRTSAVLSRSTMLAPNSTIDSMAKVSAAIRASLSAIAACLPMGTPHCTRSLAHFRARARHRLDRPAQAAGIVKRPVFSVLSATRKPLPSDSRIFSRGTRTLVNCTTPL